MYINQGSDYLIDSFSHTKYSWMKPTNLNEQSSEVFCLVLISNPTLPGFTTNETKYIVRWTLFILQCVYVGGAKSLLAAGTC